MGNRANLSRVKGPSDPSAALDYATRQYVDAAAYTYFPVANGTHFNGNGGATVTSLPQGRLFETRKLLRVIAGGADVLQIEWANIWTSNTPQALDATCEIAGPNAVTVRMGIEYPAGNMRIVSGSAAWGAGTAYAIRDQVTSGGASWVAVAASTGQTPADGSAFWVRVNRYLVRWEGDDGAGTISFAAGDYKKSLPLTISELLNQGDLIAILGSYDTGSPTNRVPYAGMAGASNTAPFVDWVLVSSSPMAAAGSALADTGITTQINNNSTTANSTTISSWMKIPYATAITGNTPVKRCVALFGDSLIQGAGGDIRDGEGGGFFVRSVDNATWWRIAQGGNQASCYTKTNAPWQYSCARRCTAIVTDMLINDIQAGLTFSVTQARMVRLWNALSSLGPPVYAGYPTPISLSSDSWATTANQSRWTTGGASAFPGDDATYLTSVYGQIAMWMSQDGAGITVDGATTQVGQPNHPLQGLLDWRTLMADSPTSWKWTPTYTTDGAHPTASAVQIQTAYLRPQMEIVLGSEQTPPHCPPAPSGAGSAPVSNMDRSLANVAGPGSGTGSIMTFVGVSPGRLYYGARLLNATASNKSWTLFIGADPAKLKAVANGTTTGPPGANSILTLTLSSPMWIPAGYLMYLQLTIPAISAWGGTSALAATLNRNGLNFATAGNNADTGVVTVGTVANATPGASFKWTSLITFRAWAEIF